MDRDGVFSMLICSDNPESDICRMVRVQNGKVLNIGGQKVTCKFHLEAELAKDPSRVMDLIVFTGRNYEEADIRRLAQSKQYKIGYFVNCLPKVDPDPKKNYSQRAMAAISRDLNLLYRTAPCEVMSAEMIENDIVNLIHLVNSEEEPEYKDYLTKRFLDATNSMEEMALIFGEEVVMRKQNEKNMNGFEAFPIALAKSRVPVSLYEKARATNKVQNHLWMLMSYDSKFILETCEELEHNDDFVKRFTDMVRRTQGNPLESNLKLAISRNDYIASGESFYQVEFNLIASGMGPITQRHFKALDRINDLFQDKPRFEVMKEDPEVSDSEKFLARAMKASHDAYGVPDAIIVLVCGTEKNAFDQFSPSKHLSKEGIRFVRYSFQDLRVLLTVDPGSRRAKILGSEVALFYLRDGFMPHQYDEEDWAVREKIESSISVKCPDASLQLINMKYFQYVINKSETWKRFGFSEEDYLESRRTFCSIFSFKDFENSKEKMMDFIVDNGGYQMFVLKPQREGGANNLFGEEIREAILKMEEKELGSYILMQKIIAKSYTNIHCDWKCLRVRSTIDEIGYFHFNLWKNGKIIDEGMGGSLVRSKMSQSNEGGVSSGYAVVNSFEITK